MLEITLARARATGLSVTLLDPLSDVDTVEDLRRLRRELDRLRQTDGARVPLNTEACLKAIGV